MEFREPFPSGVSCGLAQRGLCDQLLLQRASAGDQRAFETLVARYQSMLYTCVSAYVGSEQAYDVMQFVWLQCYLSLPKLLREWRQAERGRETSLKPWLLRIAHNRCIDELRRRKRGPLLFSELELDDEEDAILSALPDLAPLPEELAEQREARDHLQAALQRLSSKLRRVVWMRYKEDLTFVEIGRRLNIPSTTAKTYYHRACVKLRVALCS